MRRFNPESATALLSILIFFFFISHPAHAISNTDCLACHDVDRERFEKSIHGANPCTSCHADVTRLPHDKKPGAATCGSCHRAEQQVYLASDHGKAVAKGAGEAASCGACHGEGHYLKGYRDSESHVSRDRINGTCSRCHDDPSRIEGYHLTQREPAKSYTESVHGKAFESGKLHAAVCTDCHGSHDLNSPNNPESRIYKFNVPATCGSCHEGIFNTYKKSVHAKALYDGVKDAPVCTDCHGEHAIRKHSEPSSSVSASSIVKTCAHCHDSEKIVAKYGLPTDVLKTYLQSYHGLAHQYGSLVAANCASCHGFHDILPSSDPRSSINEQNIGRTCGKCHAGAGEKLSQGSVHIRPSVDRDTIIFYLSLFYIAVIILTIGAMLAHNLLDYARKLKLHYRRSVLESVAMRMSLGERIQHVILLVCFLVLVYTGFAHKYPNAFFSYPFNLVEWGPLLRKVIHRAAGVVFMMLMCYHAAWMTFTQRGREKLRALWPCRHDVTEAIALVKYNLGLSPERPKFDRYSYIEKAEYWALIWGTVVMAITGLVLMFENVSLHYLPKWLIDVMLVIHFFEALLATLAILVWHLYWTIFDPDVYPMNWTWITGTVTRLKADERRSGAREPAPPDPAEPSPSDERSQKR